jgi:hypothetical protein
MILNGIQMPEHAHIYRDHYVYKSQGSEDDNDGPGCGVRNKQMDLQRTDAELPTAPLTPKRFSIDRMRTARARAAEVNTILISRKICRIH